MQCAGRCPTAVCLVLVLHSMTAHCLFCGTAPVSVALRRGAKPRMEAVDEVAQLEAQLKILQLRAQIAEMEAQAPAASPIPAPGEQLASPPPLPVPAPSEVLNSPPPLPVPAPAEVAVSEPTLPAPAPVAPLPEAEVCLGLSGEARECTELVDLNDLLGGIKPAFSFDSLPSLDKLLQLETAVPLIGGLAIGYVGYVGVSKASKSLRPDDAATARRKREERERLGLSESDEEQDNQASQDGLVAAVLIVVFELVLFNLRNV